MGKHKVFPYTKFDPGDRQGYDYADYGGSGIDLNHRPMVGDVIVQLENGYPLGTLVIEQLILLSEGMNPGDETAYWHAYCNSVGFDFSLIPYYGKSGDIPKLAAHAVDQRAVYIGRYGEPPDGFDIKSYGEKCKTSVRKFFETFREAKKK